MTEYKYTYSVQDDFPNNAVSNDRLTSEIMAAAAITVALNRIETYLDACDIYFKAELSGGMETALDAIVAAHSGTPFSQVSMVKLDCPTTADGKPIMQTSIIPQGANLYLSGAGDSSTNRGAGDLLTFTKDVSGDDVKEVIFLDPVIVLDAVVTWVSAQLGDYFSAEVVVPATVVTPNQNNTGNCTLMDAPSCPGLPEGCHIIIPAAGDGTHDVDLATANPVPSHTDYEGSNTGLFDWSEPYTGKGVVSVNPTMTGGYHLVDKEVKLINYGNRCPLLGSNILSISGIYLINAKQILPQWKGRFTLHNSGHSGLQACVCLKLARYLSVS